MWDTAGFAFATLFASSSQQNWVELALKVFPLVVFLEAPSSLLVTAGIVKYGLREHRRYASAKPIRACRASLPAIPRGGRGQDHRVAGATAVPRLHRRSSP